MKSEIMKFAGKWIDLESILSKVKDSEILTKITHSLSYADPCLFIYKWCKQGDRL